MRRLLVFGLWALIGCGDEAVSDLPGFRVALRVTAEDDVVRTCRAGDGIETLRVERVDPATEATELLLITDDTPCRVGELDVGPLAPGVHTLRFEASGRLQGLSRRLFFAEASVTVAPAPSAERPEIVLQPEVAYVRISWVPPEDPGATCQAAWSWGYVIEPDAGTVNASGRIQADFDCDQTSVRLERPLNPGRYVIAVTMTDEDGNARFERVETRVLSPGTNVFQALLAPIRGRLVVDWLFALDGVADRDCHAVDVDQVNVHVRDAADGRLLLDHTIDCSVPRPTTLSGVEGPFRVPAEADLELRITAEGAHRFEGQTTFSMPAGEHEVVLELEPRGQARIAWELVGELCSRPPPSRFDVAVRDPALDAIVWSGSVPAAASSTTTGLLPYGPYQVSIVAPRVGAARCGGAATARLDERLEVWEPIPLTEL